MKTIHLLLFSLGLQIASLQASQFGLFTYVTFINDVNGQNEVAITDYPETSDLAEVFVPAIIEGLPVTEIDSSAFQNSLAQEVHLPDSITNIKDYAFANSPNLLRIVIPDSVITMGEFALSDCTALSEVTISQNLPEIPESAFSNTAISQIFKFRKTC